MLQLSFFREQFTKFDANSDGLIDVEEFGQFMRALGLIPSDDEVKVGVEYLECYIENV